MYLSIDTMNLLANNLECPEASKVYDEMVDVCYDHFMGCKPKSAEKLYFKFRSTDGKIFLETETKY